MKNVFTYILILATLLCSAQTNDKSMYVKMLKTATNDTTLINAYGHLTLIYAYDNIDSAKYTGFKALELVKPTTPPKYQCIAIVAAGQYYSITGMPDSAIYYYNRALFIARKNNIPKSIARISVNLATLYNKMGMYDKSLKASMESYKIAEQDTTDKELYINTTISLANSYVWVSMVDEALYYSFKARKMLENSNDVLTKGTVAKQIGGIYLTKRDYDNATAYYNEALALFTPYGDNYTYDIYLNLAGINHAKGDDDQAIKYYTKGYAIAVEIQDPYSSCQALVYMGDIALKRKDLQAAKKYYVLAYPLAQEIHSNEDIRNTATALADIYNTEGNNGEAYKYLLVAKTIGDSLSNKEKNQAIAEMAVKYETEKVEGENKRLQQQTEINQLLIQRQYLIIGILAVMLLLIVFGGLFFYRQRRLIDQQRQTILEQKLLQMQLNPHFIFNSLQSVQNYIYSNEADKASGYLAKFARLMRDILESSRTETIALAREIEIITNYLSLQKIRLGDKLTYTISVDSTIIPHEIDIPPMLLQPFIENAIEHGIMKKEGNGEITIAFKKTGNMLTVSITDNGPGISTTNYGSTTHQSVSVKIINERLSLLTKRSKNTAAVNISSPKDTGTLVKVLIPVS